MSRRDKRRMPRVACSLDVRVHTRTGWVPVRVLDLSRRGVRLALDDEAVGVHAGASLLEVARRLGGLLPEWMVVELGEDPILSRKVRVVRIGKRSGKGGTIELGCLFADPLQDLDAVRIGVVLPAEGESWEQAERRQSEARALYESERCAAERTEAES